MKAETILSQAGYKLTRPRLAVLKCLQKQNRLFSARDLFKKIKNVDQASVYRTLKIFEELSVVNTEIVNKEKLYCLADHPHHHVICRKCGYSEEFPCIKKQEYKKFKNFTDLRHQLTLVGVCGKCNKL